VASSDFFLFVSHVAENRDAAMAIVDELERRGTRCWIAPRDVRPGEPFDDEIADAIEACRAMLLIFSNLCNESEYIRREVTVAGESHKAVISFRIEDAQPRRGLRIRLSDLHWIDGFTSREHAIDEVIKKFAPSTNGPVAPQLHDDGQQSIAKAKYEPKAADPLVQPPQVKTAAAGTAADEQIATTVAKPEPVAAHTIHRDIADAAAPHSPEGHETAGSADTARPLPKSHKEEASETRKEANLRATAPARSNINFGQIVRALLVLQGIGRPVLAAAMWSALPARLQDLESKSFAAAWIAWGAVTIAIALPTVWHRKWAREWSVFGMLVCVGVLYLDVLSWFLGSFYPNVSFLKTWSVLYAAVDVVIIIYFFRYRAFPRKA
jgi:hypothetical protein